jgi:hypothetical protein
VKGGAKSVSAAANMFERVLPFRNWRWQFSLRALLLVMAVAGGALAIYRWPWEEAIERTYQIPVPNSEAKQTVTEIVQRVTYHRDWRGRPVKHGRTLLFSDNVLYQEEHYYEGILHGLKRAINRAGQTTEEKHYRDGKLHGPYRSGDGTTWIWHGTFVNNQWHGEWSGLCKPNSYPQPFTLRIAGDGSAQFPWQHFSPNPLAVQSNWRHGVRHGSWTWRTLDGKLVHTAEYDRGDLVRWNGEPVVEQFSKWFAEAAGQAPLLLAELTNASTAEWRNWSNYGNKHLCFRFGDGDQLVIHLDGIARKELQLPTESNGHFVPALCEIAARNQLRFDYRYGALWLIPHSSAAEPFVDRTGVLQINFAENSRHKRDWDEPIMVTSCQGDVDQCVEHLLAQTTLKYEPLARRNRAAVQSPVFEERLTLGLRAIDAHLFKRRRRDALAYVLFVTGCRCELRGDTLHILPQSKRTSEQVLCLPLEPAF